MNFWLDAQLPPQFAHWLTTTFGISATSLLDLGLRDAEDQNIFKAARSEGTVIITKDSDFIELVTRLGTPPQILWVTCGNVTNRNLRRIFTETFPEALALLQTGEIIVEITEFP